MTILDPELVRQLSISSDEKHVEAVVRLRSESGAPALPPEETEHLAKELVARARKASGEHEAAINVFRYLGSFAISAKPSFLKTLIGQPEVAAALANRQPESGMITPVEKRPAHIEDVGREKVAKRRAAPRRLHKASGRPGKRRPAR